MTEEYKEYRKKYEKAYREARQTGGYFVYYIPSIHYCGIAKDLYARESWHRNKKKINTDGLKVLYHSMDKSEAAHHEAMFQSVLGIKGLNVKSLNQTL